MTHPKDRKTPFYNPFLECLMAGPGHLTKEAFKLYNATSFAMHEHGQPMNAQVTLNWRMLGVKQQSRAAHLLSVFNYKAGKMLAVGAPDKPRSPTERAWLGSSPYMYVYVHENIRDQGFHTHQLCYIPPEMGDSFNEWVLTCFGRLLKRSGVSAQAISVRIDKSGNARDAVARCWDRYMYITKTLCPYYGFCDANGRWLNARSIIKPYPFIETEPVHCPQIASGSRNIWSEAQREAGFWSRLTTGDYNRLYDGWELKQPRWES